MRHSRFVHFGLFVILFTLDFLVQTLFNMRGFRSIYFVSQMHLLGLFMMTEEDGRFEITLKLACLAFFVDLLHYQTFPIFYISYGLAAILVRIWYRHIGQTYIELSMLMGIGLLVKELAMYYSLYFLKGQTIPLMQWLASRSVWVILGNLLFLPVVHKLFKESNKIIHKITYR